MVARAKSYGIRALEMDLGIKIPLARVRDYTGRKMQNECNEDHARGAAPHSPCNCAGARMAEDLTGAIRCSVIRSRVFAWDGEWCTRYWALGTVRHINDYSPENLIGATLILKAPGASFTLEARQKGADKTHTMKAHAEKTTSSDTSSVQKEVTFISGRKGHGSGIGRYPNRGRRSKNLRIETVRARERLEKKKQKHGHVEA